MSLWPHSLNSFKFEDCWIRAISPQIGFSSDQQLHTENDLWIDLVSILLCVVSEKPVLLGKLFSRGSFPTLCVRAWSEA